MDIEKKSGQSVTALPGSLHHKRFDKRALTDESSPVHRDKDRKPGPCRAAVATGAGTRLSFMSKMPKCRIRDITSLDSNQ